MPRIVQAASRPPARPHRRGRLRLAAGVLGSLAVLMATAAPAAADPARPTDYRSRVLSVRPSLPAGVTVQVVGGDGFLEVSSVGHEVTVLDQIQDGEGSARPYLRIRRDGTVQLNRSSIGYYVNRTRYGGGSPPLDIQRPGGLPPSWKTVGHHGRYLWHDHRIHWMSPGKPPSVHGSSGKVDMGGPGGDWVVRLVVDGRPAVVLGELRLVAPPAPLAWLALAAAVGAVVTAAGLRRWRGVVAGMTIVAAGAGVLVGWEQHLAVPAAAGGTPLSWALPLVALVAGILAAALRRPVRRSTALLAAAAALAGWVVMRWTVLTHSVLPTHASGSLDRAGTAVALGTAVAVAVVTVRAARLADGAAPPARPAVSRTG